LFQHKAFGIRGQFRSLRLALQVEDGVVDVGFQDGFIANDRNDLIGDDFLGGKSGGDKNSKYEKNGSHGWFESRNRTMIIMGGFDF
jgi:hypothetical protein